MQTHNQKKMALLLAAVISNLALPHTAFAEGGDRRPSGDYGINRRIRSTDGYVAVEAAFTASFNQPPLNASVKSAPSFYLGGRGIAIGGGEREVDAGLQFDDTPPDSTYEEGWTAFISASSSGNSIHTNPRLWDSTKGWKFWRGPADRAYTLKYVVEADGKLRLDVSGGLGSFYWLTPGADTRSPTNATTPDGIPDDAPQGQTLNDGTTPFPNVGYNTWPWQSLGEEAMNPAHFNSHSVKRVIAITQEAPYGGYLDGTVMTCKVTAGTIYPYTTRAELDWNKDRTNQADVTNGTGYDTPQNLSNPFAWDRLNGTRIGTGARPKVNFPEVDQKNTKVPNTTAYPARDRRNPIARTDRDSSYDVTEDSVTRYKVETVNLSLRSTTNPKTTPYRAKSP